MDTHIEVIYRDLEQRSFPTEAILVNPSSDTPIEYLVRECMAWMQENPYSKLTIAGDTFYINFERFMYWGGVKASMEDLLTAIKRFKDDK